jgi:hypothetical protein
VLNPLIDVTDDVATASSYYVRLDEHPDGPYIRVFGRYRDRLVRCQDGHWRIRERLAESESSAGRDFPPAPWTDLPIVVRGSNAKEGVGD